MVVQAASESRSDCLDRFRASEGLKTWAKLLQIRDEQVLEPRWNAEAEKMEYVVPSVKVLVDVCFKILAYTWGTPIQQTDDLDQRIKTLERRLNELSVGPLHGKYLS